MADKRGKEIVDMRDRAVHRQANFRNLWQDVADLQFPQTYPIIETHTPGRDLMQGVFDVTAIVESENMASGLSNNIMPPGQEFFKIKTSDKALSELPHVDRYLQYLTERAHEELVNSASFTPQADNALHTWVVFGTANVLSDWKAKHGLIFREFPIGTYQCYENEAGIIDTTLLMVPMTAAQAVERWGVTKVGPAIAKAYMDPGQREEQFDIIQLVGPRNVYMPWMKSASNYPFESVFVAAKDKHTISDTGGFPENPFHIARYRVTYGEIYGRGMGTLAHRQVRYVNRLRKDFMEMSNKWVNPPREVLESVDSEYDVSPGAVNYVTQLPSSRELYGEAKGSPPVGKDVLEFERDVIRELYFKNVFEQLSMLTGDRRTTLEIYERVQEGLKKLSKPIGRLFGEFFSPLITRSVLLLIRNGVVEPPPPELQGQTFKLKYIGPLAKALEDQQARGFEQWVDRVAVMSDVFPGAQDNVDYDRAVRDLGDAYGVKSDHIRPVRERDMMRQQRQEEIEAQKAAELAAMAAQGYGQTVKKPESGSAAEQVMAAVNE
jgi:hypothetical protein